jgi:DNA-binding response OmpR family regulator
MKLLIVEDDQELARQLKAELAAAGYVVSLESNGTNALKIALQGDWQIAIMDVALPGVGGFSIVEKLRAAGIEAPVIFLTARGEVADRVRGLSLGADDYLTKPFSMEELKARMQVLLRRHAKLKAAEGPQLPAGWVIQPLLRQVEIQGRVVALQPREWSALELFLAHEGEVLTKSFLLDRVWGIRFDPGTNVVDAMVFRLRKKLDEEEHPSYFETLRGRGYVFHRHD